MKPERSSGKELSDGGSTQEDGEGQKRDREREREREGGREGGRQRQGDEFVVFCFSHHARGVRFDNEGESITSESLTRRRESARSQSEQEERGAAGGGRREEPRSGGGATLGTRERARDGEQQWQHHAHERSRWRRTARSAGDGAAEKL